MAIVIERTITIKDNISTLDNPLYLYTGDGDITYLFTIKEMKKSARFGQISQANVITEEGYFSYGDVRIYKPNEELAFTARAQIIDDKLQAIFSFEDIDNITESGIHQLQIHLYVAETGERNRFTIPPVNLHVLLPVGTTTSAINQAIAGYSVLRVDSIEEPEDAFNEDGTYNATDWNISDVITAVKLNKIEEAISALASSSGGINTSNFATKDDIGNIDAILDNINGEVI
jgi:hypothetical protein